jgi:hypothetical protein
MFMAHLPENCLLSESVQNILGSLSHAATRKTAIIVAQAIIFGIARLKIRKVT